MFVRQTLIFALALTCASAQDLFIVSIGDSFASGEGNPNSFTSSGAAWSDAPCHRSNNNGRRFASNRLNNIPGVTTAFFDVSCSGATIQNGLLNGQSTNQPDSTPVTVVSQIDRVANFQRLMMNNRQIDILMISIGGNDANFASVVTSCMQPDDCRFGTAMNTARDIIAGTLPGRYDRLAEAIRSKLNVRRVYITEYPNLVTRSSASDFCGNFNDFPGLPALDGLILSGISEAESEFTLNEFIKPLNDRIRQAATRHGWTYIAGPEDTFATHGFCTSSSRRYANTVFDSFNRQGNHKGILHPNIDGHRAYADAIIRRATIDFNLPMANPRIIRKFEGNLSVPGPIALPGVEKTVEVEVAQHPGTLSAVVQHRIRTAGQSAPPFASTAMSNLGTGRLSLFGARIPNSEFLSIGQTLEYRFVITATRNGVSVSTTSPTESIVLLEGLEQE